MRAKGALRNLCCASEIPLSLHFETPLGTLSSLIFFRYEVEQYISSAPWRCCASGEFICYEPPPPDCADCLGHEFCAAECPHIDYWAGYDENAELPDDGLTTYECPRAPVAD